MDKQQAAEYKKPFGVYMRQCREAKGYTQELLAKKLGVTPKSISCHECGINFPSFENFFELAKILEMSLDKFVFGSKMFFSIPGIDNISEKIQKLTPENQEFLLSMIDYMANQLYMKQHK